jgi:hypothetical protein
MLPISALPAGCGVGLERKGLDRKGKERKGKERKGKERKGKERKGKERKGKDYAFRHQFNEKPSIMLGCPACMIYFTH